MERINIELEHCYGIKTLKAKLDFSNTQAYAIYAPNGVMKSSLAQTFQDVSKGEPTTDRMFPSRITTRKISDDSGSEIGAESILVVFPYDAEFGPTEKTSTLLVNADLRKEYEQLHESIDKAKDDLLKAIKKKSNAKSNFEHEIVSTFTSGDDLEIALNRIRDELAKQTDTPFSGVPYDIIFNDKVRIALDAADIKEAVEDYIRRYNELLSASTFFKKGTFDYYNAGLIAKNLATNGFFAANHTVNLKSSGETLEINTQQELEEVITKEKDAILKDDQLRKKFDDVAQRLHKNVDLRKFCRYLQDNEALLSRMNNLQKFKEDVLKSYLKALDDLYLELMQKYEEAAKRKKEIEEEARKQQTQWEEVIEIFNDRFFVPFELNAKNRIDVMLGNDPIIELGFTYVDGAERVTVDKPSLLKVLSTGEKKALYVINVIFEVERRRKENVETIVVVDDIADSFDYQNKYAIVQYLDDISKNGLFKLIIMSHNFDFFRTIESRRIASYKNCLMASKNGDGVQLTPALGIKNIFANDWKIKFFTDTRKKIASIPFLRNRVEMTTGDQDSHYKLLTSMLHWKTDSNKITVSQLDDIFNNLCNENGVSSNSATLVHDLICNEAQKCILEQAGQKLENKIALAMAIRCLAERYMIERIQDEAFVESIVSNQTQLLIGKFKYQFSGETIIIEILDRVALMTPENIHVNSFMYEPIVDMSDEHLKKLFVDVVNLK